MPLFSKPQFNNVWASTGVKLTPDSAKISQGWVVEIPPHEYENWVQGRQDQLLAHLNQVGIPMWDATVEYQANKSYVQGSVTGNVYRALTTNINLNPELDIQNNWTIAFQASGEALLKSQNLSDVPDKAQARNNLGIPDTVFYDNRYLQQTNNLADVPNKTSARNNLNIYSKSETYSRTEIDNLPPAGEFSFFLSSTPPPGWLVLAGQVLSKTTYARLYTAIGGTWGETSTTFTLPDVRGEFIRAWDNGRGADPGRQFGSSQAATVGTLSVYATVLGVSSGTNMVTDAITINGTVINDNSSGGRNFAITPTDTRGRNIAFLPCVRY